MGHMFSIDSNKNRKQAEQVPHNHFCSLIPRFFQPCSQADLVALLLCP